GRVSAEELCGNRTLLSRLLPRLQVLQRLAREELRQDDLMRLGPVVLHPNGVFPRRERRREVKLIVGQLDDEIRLRCGGLGTGRWSYLETVYHPLGDVRDARRSGDEADHRVLTRLHYGAGVGFRSGLCGVGTTHEMEPGRRRTRVLEEGEQAVESSALVEPGDDQVMQF